MHTAVHATAAAAATTAVVARGGRAAAIARRLARRAALAIPVLLLLAACDDDPANVDESLLPGPNTTITQTAVATPDLSTLVAALQAAQLDQTLAGPGPFTVFAPVNAAFSAIPADQTQRLLDAGNRPLLTKVLTYHVVPGIVRAAQLTDGQTLTTVQGGTLRVSLTGGARVNGARIVRADVRAANGVIHFIDRVLTDNLDIVDVATLRGFSSLVGAVQAAGLTDALRGNGAGQGLTVFAPTNAAFTAIPGGAPSNPQTLASVLRLHVVAGRAAAASITNGQTFTSLLGQPLTAAVAAGSVSITGPRNTARVTATDVPASNGIIHVIDSVLLP